MLYNLLKDINEIIRSELPEIRMIDFDRGQLQNPERYESIIQPAVLVGIPNINWRELPQRNQEGDLTFFTKTVVRLPHDTGLYNHLPVDQNDVLDNNIAENEAELLLEDAVHQQICTLEGVCRVRSSYYFVKTFFVVEHTYTGYMYYESRPRYRKHTLANQPNITNQLN